MVVDQRGARRCTEEAGSSLLELLVALSIFGIFVVGLAPVMFQTMNLARNNRNRSVAANLASRDMDFLRSLSYANLQTYVGRTTDATAQNKIDGVQFTLTRDGEWVDPGATTSACSGGATARPRFLRFSLTVTWPDMRGAQPVKSQTIITPPVSSYDPYTGAIAISLTGSAVSNLNVTVAGPTAAAGRTTSDGCLFLPYLDAGTYQITLNSPRYVDFNGTNPVVKTSSVSTGQLTQIGPLPYDLGATLIATIVTPRGGFIPRILPLTVGNTSLSGGRKSLAGPLNGQPTPLLFPFQSGYQIWPGDCNDADPEGADASNTKIYPTGARGTAVAVQPDRTSTVLVTMPEANATVTVGGAPMPAPSSVTLRAQHVAPTTDCVAGGATLNWDPINQSTFVAGLPLGKWNLTATLTPGGATRTINNVTIVPGGAPPNLVFAF